MRAQEGADCLNLVCELLGEAMPDWEFQPPVGGRSLWARFTVGSATRFANVATEEGGTGHPTATAVARPQL